MAVLSIVITIHSKAVGNRLSIPASSLKQPIHSRRLECAAAKRSEGARARHLGLTIAVAGWPRRAIGRLRPTPNFFARRPRSFLGKGR
jgi:hypothetical protein